MVTTTALLFLGVLTAVCSAGTDTKKRYEDDESHFNEQLLSDFVEITEKWYVFKRNFGTSTSNRCHSATKKGQEGENYKYDLTARFGSGTYLTYTTTIKPETTPPHQQPNAGRYNMQPGEDEVTRKIMTLQKSSGCAILIDALQTDERRCQFLVKKSVVTETPPADCENVYKENCGSNSSITLWTKDCQ